MSLQTQSQTDINTVDIQKLLARTDDKALMEADTGSHYQTAYTYFYVPGAIGSAQNTADDAGLGTLIRLGGYSDLEEAAETAGTLSVYYPSRHIDDEGSSAAALQNAASGSQGILFACDGRILLKTAERMYFESAAFHHDVDGDYVVEATGNMSLSTTGASGTVDLKSINDTVTITSGNNKSITIDAGNGTGDLEENVKTATRKIGGDEYTVTKGAARSWTEGTTTSFYWGATCSISAGVGFYLSMGADIFIKPVMSLSWTTLGLAFTGVSVSWTGVTVDLEEVSMKLRGVQTESQIVNSKLRQINHELNTLQVDMSDVSATTEMLSARAGYIDSQIGSIKADIQDINCKI
ncbi:hypothetical protein E1180_08260 [Roseibium denhamense]|uniref:DUF1983 domain-containing protein n=1 Tax=Roseibium denhamense TaxID=76305 RepID=A0ABY1PIJ0_9HYPH|nr:hypothetical protein [Roseibium denhamense]MTI05508.1 hypothetical protein [Roseibium denhamense]SMP35171.1 hypothetical protein SAMN06265374_3972 [Roseibium denhamense]